MNEIITGTNHTFHIAFCDYVPHAELKTRGTTIIISLGRPIVNEDYFPQPDHRIISSHPQ